MVLRKFIIVSAMLAAIPLAAKMQIIDRDYDFGLMKEAAGPKTGHARFLNPGPGEISFTEVRPSCGCTSADFPKEPIAPGDTATISFTYDPFMRPGKFDKTVKVFTDDGGRFVVHIRGNVLGTPESLDTMYPLDAGLARLSDSIINAGEVIMGHAPTSFVNVYTTSLDSIKSALISTEKALKIKTARPITGPGDLSTYSLTFYPAELNQYGPIEIPLTFESQESRVKSQEADSSPLQARSSLQYRAFVLPDTDLLARKFGAKAPACAISPDPVELGQSLPSSGEIQTEFTVANEGKAEMQVLRIYSDSQAVKILSTPSKIKPGKKAKVKLTLDLSLLPTGPSRIPVSVITDDPLHPHFQTYLTLLKE